MPHYLIVGMTESGKTRLATAICEKARKRHVLTAVLDPLADERWRCDYATTDLSSFQYFLRRRKKVMGFIDESGISIDKYSKEDTWMVTMGRHYGHSLWLICQDIVQLAPIVRSNCSHCYMFACSSRNVKLLAEDFNKPEILDAPPLNRGEFYKLSRFEKIQKFAIDFRTGNVRVMRY